MRIAQLSVAGEALSRPKNSEPSSAVADQEALDEYACDRSNLPWVIFRAAHRATHTTALPARARALLAALARTVDASRPFAPIFARRELLTGRAQQSMRTFYRSMDDLEGAGFIIRPPQTRYGAAGLFGRAYIHLTQKAAALLGLVDVADATTTQPAQHRESASDAQAGFSDGHPSVTVADGAIYKDLLPNTQKRQPGRLPADLQRLVPLGFREFLIFKLMREAKAHGKLLSDVVEASWAPLQRATHPISYLRTLLRVPVDFAYRARSQREAHVQQQIERTTSARTDEVVGGLAGRSFVSRDGLRRYRVSDDARSIVICHRDEPHPRVHAGTWQKDFVAAFEAGHILLDDKDRFGSHVDFPTPLAAGPIDLQRKSEARLSDIKALLRLKSVGGTPSAKPRDVARPMQKSKSAIAPLSSLLQAVLGAAPSTNFRDSPGTSSC